MITLHMDERELTTTIEAVEFRIANAEEDHGFCESLKRDKQNQLTLEDLRKFRDGLHILYEKLTGKKY